ncbi:tagatose 1,6-diphosphate aldolase [Hoeflea prorocentri]|uniref:Tagatose 1,6-diphosphate aldolase n=1 Tax=Hoeflea prorocentri TaxID=1922333 RepID=A0A9X3UE99_9HYPH|nr:tagatose 1,6-diphosphate aldolase [Hoeflea prorocentri]MCY6379818.1 tagatose 1,6-diphosphate aldolase [Hoeflea prorocentri]MDA5397618.1 tagatose 1,6-diphosphate aldolase [Hoeflea prorocentri]
MPQLPAAIHGVAVDAGSGLATAIRTAREDRAQPDDLLTFKRNVLKALGPDATTVLVDAQCGSDLLQDYPDGCAPMIAFEADVYHISDDDRITVLPDHLSVSDFPGMGVKQLKFFMYYAPDDADELNARKLDIVAGIGDACASNGVRYLVEPLVYHPAIEAGSVEFARLKPDLVRRATKAFADPRLKADVLKVEVPVDLRFVEGFGEPAMSRAEALDAFRMAAEPAGGRDLVYLSAGVAFEFFEASLRLAREAGVDFSGFMCGRAIWSDAVGVFGAHGEDALKTWLEETGRERLLRLIAALN